MLEHDGPASPRDLRVIIFSKDRPLQVDAAIRSLKANCADFDATEIHVLFKASTSRSMAGYRVAAAQHRGATFHPEGSFKADLIELLGDSQHVLFVVDDTIFLNALLLDDAVSLLDAKTDCLGFSFRLGRNTTYCYPLDKTQSLPTFAPAGRRRLIFDWTASEYDFGYPLEISSSMYRTAEIAPLLARLSYRDPNTLEAALAIDAASLRASHPQLGCYERSVSVSIPANRVQVANANRTSGREDYAPDALLERYFHGDRLDVNHYRGLISNACHQELDLIFEKDASIPTVSVVIPCFKQAEYLPDAVRSVAAQTFSDWEIIVVNDGSPDDTVTVASGLAKEFDGRVRLISQENAGLAAARNIGVVMALGRYILPLDADDTIAPMMLASTVRALNQDPRIAIAYTDERTFGELESLVQTIDFDAFTLPAVNEFCYCSLYRREVWEAVGGYNTNLVHGYEDWDFWIGAVENGYQALRVPGAFFEYRVRKGSMSEAAQRHDQSLRRQIRLNHPALFRPWLRVARTVLLAIQRLNPSGPWPIRKFRSLALRLLGRRWR